MLSKLLIAAAIGMYVMINHMRRPAITSMMTMSTNLSSHFLCFLSSMVADP